MVKLIAAVVIIVVAVVFIYAWAERAAVPTAANASMLITSPSFKNNEYIPKKYSCEGGNINPELDISGVPERTKSLALIMHDPDAPIPGGFTHWLVWNINPEIIFIKEESVPPGSVEGANGRNSNLYTGPCPPLGHGIHHYHFMLYALNDTLNLPAGSSKSQLEAAMQGHILAQTEIVGLYQRQ